MKTKGDDCCYNFLLSVFLPFSPFSLSLSLSMFPSRVYFFISRNTYPTNHSPVQRESGRLQKASVLSLFCRTDDLYLELVRVVHRNRSQTANNTPLVEPATNSFGLQEIVVGRRDHAWNHKAYT